MKNIFIIFLIFLGADAVAQNLTYSTEVYGACGMCEDRILKAVNALPFITSSQWSSETQELTVIHTNKFDEQKLHQAIAKVGHDTELMKAEDKVYEALHGCCHYRDPEVLGAHSNIPTNTIFEVKGNCDMCKQRIEKAAKSIAGVKSASYNLDEQKLYINHEKDIDISQIHKAIAAAGHETPLAKPNKEVYDALPSCCHYSDPNFVSELDNKNEMYIGVSGNCGMCKTRIEESAMQTAGVLNAKYDIENQSLWVDYNTNFDEAHLHRNIAETGHDTEQLLANEDMYNALPACCQYKDEKSKRLNHLDKKRSKKVEGYVYEQTDEGQSPLELAEVYTVDQSKFTLSDEKGYFELELNQPTTDLVVRFVGYRPDTIRVSQGSSIEATLSNINNLKEVVVTYRKQSAGVSFLKTIKTVEVDDSELLKAACCNLAESFETLPAVDVATTDAVTGTRQIKMLGLAGPNILYTREQLPMNTGISAIQGLTLIPGTWIESMQLNQGMGSAVDGYESISGQINVELRKPETMDPAYVNLYANEGGRLEGNAHLAKRFSENLSTGLLLHGNLWSKSLDRNEDGFKDNPTGDGFNIHNRWKYKSDIGIHSQFNVYYAQQNNDAGQFEEEANENLWTSENNIQNGGAWFKMGYLNPDNPLSSLGLKVGFNRYTQNTNYTFSNYEADQNTFNAQLVYQKIFTNPDHEIRAGLVTKAEEANENLGNQNFTRNEYVPNAFGEYTYNRDNIFAAVVGLRYDYHNIFGGFVTPRLHVQYNLENGISLRAAAGQARRVANVFSENFRVFSSNRQIRELRNEDTPYGLPMIQTQNYSLSADYAFKLFGSDASLGMDYFYTHFDENVIADFDQSAHELHVYSQYEDSYSHNFQTQIDFAPHERWTWRLAYKWQEAMLGYENGLRLATFTPKHRFFINTNYSTYNGWDFDLTYNLIGAQRITDTDMLPTELQMPGTSPAYSRINAQVSKEIFKGFTAYLGAENLTNYRQEYAIIGADNPFGEYFDAGNIWGPVMGRNLYMGIRYTIIPFDENKFE